MMIYRACLATGVQSNTVYCQRAIVTALARDLDLDEADLLARLPRPKSASVYLFNPEEHKLRRYGVPSAPLGEEHRLIGTGNTIEEVR